VLTSTFAADAAQRSNSEIRVFQRMREEEEASSGWHPALGMAVVEVEGWGFGWVAASRPPCLQPASPPIYVTSVRVVHSYGCCWYSVAKSDRCRELYVKRRQSIVGSELGPEGAKGMKAVRRGHKLQPGRV
jgi:hypothetical protein